MRNVTFTEFRKLHKDSGYVYSVEPKEYAQNISDVAATEKLTAFILALRAALPQAGTNIGASLQAMRDSQQRIQALLRKPLVVGYANSEREFGWVIGPRFKIGEGGKIGYEHGNVQHSVQATVALPAWQKTLRLRGAYHWGNEDWQPLWKTLDEKYGGSDVVNYNVTTSSKKHGLRWSQHSESDEGKMTVDLPADPSALTRALVASLEGNERHEPVIYPRWTPGEGQPQIVLKESDKPQPVLIRGVELWRNPAIFVGSQRASKLEVLPDMAGVLATFDKIEMPPATQTPQTAETGDAKPQAKFATVDLVIVTSGGSSVLRDAVQIVVGPPAAPAAPSISLATTSVVDKGDVTVRWTDPKTFPSNYAELRLLVRPTDVAKQDWVPTKANLVAAANYQTAKVALDLAADKTWFNEDHPLESAIQLRESPDAPPIVLPITGNKLLGHWHVDATRLAKVEPVTIEVKPTNPVTVTKPSIKITLAHDSADASATKTFDASYPGLRDAIRAGSAVLRLIPASGKPVELPVSEKDDYLQADTKPLTIGIDPAPAGTTQPATETTEYPTAVIHYSGTLPDVPTNVSSSNLVKITRPKP
jgi:hypothetical protein